METDHLLDSHLHTNYIRSFCGIQPPTIEGEGEGEGEGM